MFVGREREIGRIDELLEQARAGRSRVLLINGEAGSGKTSLLNLAGQRAGDMTLLRAAGIEGGEEVAFSGLFSLLRPIVATLDELPEPQAAALRVVLGLRSGTGGGPFLVGVALLGMLAAASERAPVLVMVDDLQWLDVPSLQALLFAVRRLLADRVGVLIALRSGVLLPDAVSGWLQDQEVASLPPLSRDAAVELLSTEHIAASVAAELHRLTGGNPLALKEAAARLSLGQRRGIAPALDVVALPTSVRQAYQRQLEVLPGPTRRALLVAATGRFDDLEILASALRTRDLELGDLAVAEDAGLLRLATESAPARYEWKHPLVRAAVLEAAELTEQRAAHSAQANALTAALHEPGPAWSRGQARAAQYRATRAWHQAAATIGTDDCVADELAAVAAEASGARAHVAAAAAYQRAAALTVDLPDRAERLTRAAEAAWRAGEGTLTIGIVDVALDHASDAALARLHRLKGLYELEWGPSSAAVAPLVEAFRRALGTDIEAAMEIAAELVIAAVCAGLPESDTAACECVVIADLHADRTEAHQLALATWAVHAARLLSFGKSVVRTVTGDELSRTYEVFEELAQRDPARYAYYALMNNMSGDLRRACTQADSAIETMRANGEVSALGKVLQVRAFAAYWLGDWGGAWRFATEGLELARIAGQALSRSQSLDLLAEIAALRGERAACLLYVAERRPVVDVALGYERARVGHSAGLLALSMGEYEQAANLLDEVYVNVASCGRITTEVTEILPDLVEALTMCGHRSEAAARANALVEAAEGDSERRTVALVQRARALVASNPSEAGAAFDAALQAHTDGIMDNPFHRARTRLVYGERLRRDGQRRAAREQLRAAVETFEQLGAVPWARRANLELAATGASRRAPQRVASTELTTQEMRIALLVVEGLANKEIAGQMYLSSKTIEFHLSNIYRKLGLRSRAQLARRLTDSGTRTITASDLIDP